MSLLAYNLTGVPVTLAAGNPPRILPASAAPPDWGSPVDVTSELEGLSSASWVTIQAQIDAGSIALEWSDAPKYSDGTKWRSYDITSQPTWYVDPVNGSNFNDGATPGTALATLSEFFKRMAGKSIATQMVVNLLGDLATEDVSVVGIFSQSLAPGDSGLTIQGQRTIVATGTFTNVVAYDHTPGSIAVGTVTDAALAGQWSDSGPSGSSLIKDKIILTTGPNAGSWAWLIRDEGAKTAVVSPWWNGTTWSEVTPVIGDGYEVVRLTKVRQIKLYESNFGVALLDLDLLGDPVPFLGGVTASGGFPFFYGCRFDVAQTGWCLSIQKTKAFATGCLFGNGIYATNSWFACYNCAFLGRGLRFIEDGSVFWLTGSNVSLYVNAPAVQLRQGGLLVIWGNLGIIANGAVNLMQMQPTTTTYLTFYGAQSSLWCSGATAGPGITVPGGAQFIWESGNANARFDFGAVTNDFVIGGVNKSIAALGATGFVNFTADLITGAITGNGAKVVPA